MSDFEKLTKTLNDIGIKFKITELSQVEQDEYNGSVSYDKVLKIDSGIGYVGFKCKFYFLDNKCVGHGCWE